MAKLLKWNLSKLQTPSRPLTGPLPDTYIRELTRLCEELQGVYLSGIQVGDARCFAIPNPNMKKFPIIYNPVILEQYDEIKSEKEGCLSFPGLWISIPRYKYIEISYKDGNWKECRATFGSEDASTEEALLAKAIQHEIFHMQGHVIHERMKNDKAKIKVKAEIYRRSLEQNKSNGVPSLVAGPLELDPSTLPAIILPENKEDNEQIICGENESLDTVTTEHIDGGM